MRRATAPSCPAGTCAAIYHYYTTTLSLYYRHVPLLHYYHYLLPLLYYHKSSAWMRHETRACCPAGKCPSCCMVVQYDSTILQYTPRPNPSPADPSPAFSHARVPSGICSLPGCSAPDALGRCGTGWTYSTGAQSAGPRLNQRGAAFAGAPNNRTVRKKRDAADLQEPSPHPYRWVG